MGDLDKIRTLLKEQRENLHTEYKVIEIGVFGSYARGEQKKRSDLDILVEFEEAPDLFKFIKLERYLKKILKVKVDLVRKKAIRPELRENILREVIYL